MAKPRKPHSARSRYNPRRAPGAAQPTAHVELPAVNTMPAPDVPPGVEFTDAELALWDEFWTSPQAYMVDQLAAGTVAVMIRYQTQLLSGTGSAWVATEYRHLTEAFGVTPGAMMKLAWKISEEENDDAA
ncbi:hypothetical protein [Streptomyces sp. NPDC056723]|uniref:phage terminase small subunit n=1 Tax=unclassified Streptomyces TaxID=2593676 RepID=UPI0036C74A95